MKRPLKCIAAALPVLFGFALFAVSIQAQSTFVYTNNNDIPNTVSGFSVGGISLWDRKEDAEAHNRTTYPEVQKLLAKVSEGTAQVQTCDVGTSTIHKVAAPFRAPSSTLYARTDLHLAAAGHDGYSATTVPFWRRI